MNRKRTTIRPTDLLAQPLVHIPGLSDIWRLGPPTKRNFNKNVVDACQLYKADDPTWHTDTWHSANNLRAMGYKLYHEQPFKFASRPLKAYEVYEISTYGYNYEEKEYSFGVYAGHTASEARAHVAQDRMSGGINNPWADLKTRRIHGTQADAAIEEYLGRGRYWKNTPKYARLQAQADEFNAQWPVGTMVEVPGNFVGWHDGRAKVATRTPAWVTPGLALFVSIEGCAGGVDLAQVFPLTEPVTVCS